MEVVVSLDIHLKKTHGRIMEVNGKIIRQGKFEMNEEEVKRFLNNVPAGIKVALNHLAFADLG